MKLNQQSQTINTIVKFGGSVITEKGVKSTVKHQIIKRLVSELKENTDRLVIVHGAGSFGHPLAKKYQLHKGENKSISSQELGFCLTHRSMETLNAVIVDALLEEGIPAIAIPTVSIGEMNNSGSSIDINQIIKALDNNLVPVLYGDVVFDHDKKWGIMSGDVVLKHLENMFNVKNVILCADVDGIYSDDPKNNPNAHFFDKITKNTSLSSGTAVDWDVTGGMKGKIEQLLELAENGTISQIINGNKEGFLKRAMQGEHVGTLVCGEDYDN